MPDLCVNNCGTSLQAQALIDCKQYHLGDIPVVAIITCDDARDEFVTDLTNEDELRYDAVLDGHPNDFLVLSGVQCEYSTTEETAENKVSNGQENYQRGTKFEVTIEDPNVNAANMTLIKALQKHRKGVYVAFLYNDGVTTELTDKKLYITALPAGATKNTTRTNMIKLTGFMPNGFGVTSYAYQHPSLTYAE